MDNIDILIIRACKSRTPSTRLESIRRRFYLDGSMSQYAIDQHIVEMLARCVDKYQPMTICEFIHAQGPYASGTFLQGQAAATQTELHTISNMQILIKRLRYTNVRQIDGWRPASVARACDWDLFSGCVS